MSDENKNENEEALDQTQGTTEGEAKAAVETGNVARDEQLKTVGEESQEAVLDDKVEVDGDITTTAKSDKIEPTATEVAEALDASDDEATDEDDEDEDDGLEEIFRPEDNRGPHDEFDWDAGQENIDKYTEAEREKLLKQYESAMSSIEAGQLVRGKITSIRDGSVVIDLNYKSDGLLSVGEFRGMDIDVGSTVEVYVENEEDDRGQLVLSRRKAKLLRAWEDIRDSYENGTVIKGTVISKTKGGLIVDAGGLETFLPGSQIDIKPIIDYDQYVGRDMEFKVVKINEQIKNAVVSHKALIESDLAEQREQIIASLERGQVLEGLVKNLTDFGAFLDLGGVDGLLYITDISWGRINHPSEVLNINDKINVVVLDFDENKKRISLGLKQLQPHPWDVLGEGVEEGATVKGKVVNIEDYGAFLEIQPGVEGLIHVSEISWGNQPINAKEYFDLGSELEAKIVTIDREDRKMSLSIKQLTDDPWETLDQQFPLGSRHTGKVKNLTQYGVFVQMEPGIGGMIHISDLSWTKRYGHPKEFTKVGEDIDVVILDIDKYNRKLSLGHKQIEEDPWDTFSQVFPVGSYHEGTVIRKEERGAIIQMPYGLEAYSPMKHIRKEDQTLADVDETLTFKVIEFNRDDKRIKVSHLRYLDDIRREGEQEVREARRQERRETTVAIKKTQSNVERNTLGDLDVFSQLKSQLEGNDSEDNAGSEEE